MALWRVRATVDDRPGFLAVLTASLALKAINILAVQVHTTEAGAVDDFLVDAPDRLTEAELLAAVERGRGRDAWVARADAHGLVDPPAQALALANRLVQDPESLGSVLGALVGGSVSWRPVPGAVYGMSLASGAPGSGAAGGGALGDGVPAGGGALGGGALGAGVPPGGGFGLAGTTMRLPDPAGGCYLVTRDAPDFTPAEYARAQALVDLAVTTGRRAVAEATLLLADGAEIAVRLAGPDDLEAVHAMHRRCSASSLRRRYLGAAAGPPQARLGRLLDPARGLALVAAVVSGRAGAEQAGGERAGAEQAGGERAGAEQAGGERAGGERAGGKRAGGDWGGTDRPGRDWGGTDRAGADQCGGERAGGDWGGADQVVALANLTGEGVLAEAAVLVEDGWQRRGLGTALARRLVTLAADAGYAAMVTHTLADNDAMALTLRRLGHAYTVDRDGPEVSITLPLRRASAGGMASHLPAESSAGAD